MGVTNVTNYSAWAAEYADYADNDFEGYATWGCDNGVTNNAQTRMNAYYLKNATRARMKVTWLHEMGHSLGLDHAGYKTVMWYIPNETYREGIRSLTYDDKYGLDYLY